MLVTGDLEAVNFLWFFWMWNAHTSTFGGFEGVTSSLIEGNLHTLAKDFYNWLDSLQNYSLCIKNLEAFFVWNQMWSIMQSHNQFPESFRNYCAYIWRRQWHPTPVLLPGRRSLVGCSPWGHEESDTTEQLHSPSLEKEMATHSSVLVWRIPGTGEPGGLPSVGSRRVRHDWSDLAAAAAAALTLAVLI